MMVIKILNYLFYVSVGIGRWAFFTMELISLSFRKLPRRALFLDQLFQIGVLSLPVVAITGFSTGLVLAAQAYYQFANKGLLSATGLLVGKAMLTEVGPVLTAFMITGRVGSAMTAVIGSMKITEQIDALKSMAINPMSYLVVPRFLSSLVMVPLLTGFSALMGIWGGYLISVFIFGLSPNDYFGSMPLHLTHFDLFMALMKAFIFGFFISTVACYKGIYAEGGAAGVGRAITSSVVMIYTLILVFNFLLTLSLNTLHRQLTEGL